MLSTSLSNLISPIKISLEFFVFKGTLQLSLLSSYSGRPVVIKSKYWGKVDSIHSMAFSLAIFVVPRSNFKVLAILGQFSIQFLKLITKDNLNYFSTVNIY